MSKLTEDEIKLYDRQIRLWGVEAQANLRHSQILLLNLTSVGAEVAKNLVLGGIGGLTIVDGATLLDQDLNVNFFVDETQVGQNRALASEQRIRELNPRVELKVIPSGWEEDATAAQIDLAEYNMVIATGLDARQIKKLNALTRERKVPLYVTSTHGLYGYIFADLISQGSTIKYQSSSTKKVGPIDSVSSIVSISETTENDTHVQQCLVQNEYRPYAEYSSKYIRERYPTPKKQNRRVSVLLPAMLALTELPSRINKPIEEVNVDAADLAAATRYQLETKLGLPEKILDEDTIRELARQAFCEYQPVSSILGAALSQDVINVLVHKELPINNYLLLDGVHDEMPIYTL